MRNQLPGLCKNSTSGSNSNTYNIMIYNILLVRTTCCLNAILLSETLTAKDEFQTLLTVELWEKISPNTTLIKEL